MPDGRRVPFTIPAVQLLVITSYDWVLEGSTQAGNTVWTGVDLIGASASNNGVLSAAVADKSGLAAGYIAVPAGIVVAPGTTLCLDYLGGAKNAFGRVHGYLVANP